jgi:hypothetical protein
VRKEKQVAINGANRLAFPAAVELIDAGEQLRKSLKSR